MPNNSQQTVRDQMLNLDESLRQFAMEIADLGATGSINLAINPSALHDTGDRKLRVRTTVIARVEITPEKDDEE